MNRETFRALQSPLKEAYRNHPSSALAQLSVTGHVTFDSPGCRVNLLANDGCDLIAGLHPMVGGSGREACSGDLMLQALVTCAGTTLAAVATATGTEIQVASVTATGELDFRGTLGVDRNAPVGFTTIRLAWEIRSAADADQIRKLLELTERYCVVYQTLKSGVPFSTSHTLSAV